VIRALQKLPVLTHIITGHLSVGKTTLISSLLRRKPHREHWAVLVNEFGVLGIDAALLKSSSDIGLGVLCS
jgi:G3E family GTPase